MAESSNDAFLESVNDADSRRILMAVEEEPKTVKELAEECDIPLSTAYRKIDRLEEAALVEERIQLSSSGKHRKMYERNFDSALITLSSDGNLTIEMMETSTNQGLMKKPELANP